MRHQYTGTLPRTTLMLGARTAVMGILNVTPDSFSDGGDFFSPGAAIERGKQLEEHGADILDIGGESTRPGSVPVSEEEETRRTIPVIEALAPLMGIPISIDTYRSGVARRAIEAGAQIINDVSAFRFDDQMAELAQKTRAAVILMHSRGSRSELHRQEPMTDPVREVQLSLATSADAAQCAHIMPGAIAIDPGLGFGKNAGESLIVLKSLNVLSTLPYPLVIGTSRKSFIRSIAGANPEARVWGTTVTVVTSILNGAHVVRVHDVKQMRIVADATDRILQD